MKHFYETLCILLLPSWCCGWYQIMLLSELWQRQFEQFAPSCYLIADYLGVKLVTFCSRIQCSNHWASKLPSPLSLYILFFFVCFCLLDDYYWACCWCCSCADFSRIRLHLAKRKYCSLQDFRDDVLRVFTHSQSACTTYSDHGQLQQWFVNQMNHIQLLNQ